MMCCVGVVMCCKVLCCGRASCGNMRYGATWFVVLGCCWWCAVMARFCVVLCCVVVYGVKACNLWFRSRYI